jgi:hypothetical protein
MPPNVASSLYLIENLIFGFGWVIGRDALPLIGRCAFVLSG